MLSVILMMFALVLFLVAVLLPPDQQWRAKLGLLGLACLAGAELAARMPGVNH